MNNGLSQNKLLKNTRILVFAVSLALGTLFAVVLAPMYAKSVNDVGFGFDYLTDIIDALMLISHLASFFICYAVTIYSLFRFSFKATAPTIAIFSAMTAYKYGLNLAAGWLVFDGVPTKASEINLALMSVLSNTALELAQYAVIILISSAIIKKVMPAYTLREKQLEKLGEEKFDLRSCVFPFSSFYSAKNPLQKSAFFTAVTISALQIAQLLIHDIFVGGAPTSLPDALWMIAYYLGSAVVGAIGYMLMLLILMKLDSHELKLRKKYDSESNIA